MRILVVEDDNGAIAFYRKILAGQDIEVEIARTGPEGETRALEEPFDQIILDLVLPRRSGFTVCRNLRRRGVMTPIIMVTGLIELKERLKGLDGGADDYLTKPFATQELLARVRALQRRRSYGDSLRVADLTLDRTGLRARRGDQEIILSYREYSLLAFLVSRTGQVVSRDEIVEHVWGNKPDFNRNLLDVTLCHLRRKVELEGRPRLIHSVRGAGFVLRSADDPPPRKRES